MPTFSGNQILDSALEHNSELFQNQILRYAGKPVVLNESKEAKFHKARPFLYALQSKVESEHIEEKGEGWFN